MVVGIAAIRSARTLIDACVAAFEAARTIVRRAVGALFAMPIVVAEAAFAATVGRAFGAVKARSAAKIYAFAPCSVATCAYLTNARPTLIFVSHNS